MFQSKIKKIRQYLNEKSTDGYTPFDELLSDCISGDMKKVLSGLGIIKIEIYIDWHPDIRCIDIQGKYNGNYIDLQIETDEFNIGIDPIEPDEHLYFPLESRQQVYAVVQDILQSKEANLHLTGDTI